jgi:hypothetical protein
VLFGIAAANNGDTTVYGIVAVTVTTFPTFAPVHVPKVAAVHDAKAVVPPVAGFRQLHVTAATPPGLDNAHPAGNALVTAL